MKKEIVYFYNTPTYLYELVLVLFRKKLKNVSCEYDRLNGCNSTLHALYNYN